MGGLLQKAVVWVPGVGGFPQDQAGKGKISFGAVYGEKPAELKAAIDNAVQSFEDGIYRIFLDNRPLESLDERLKVTGENVFTFVRLTMLTGRMW